MAPGLDLGSAADFATATLSDLAGIGNLLNSLTGRDPSEWDIQESSYNGVKFHIFVSKEDWQGAVAGVTDTAGRRKAKYSFPYKDGQTTDDLGRKGEGFDFDVLIHGPKYMKGYQKLLAELDKPTPGDLIHPIRGNIRCVPLDWVTTHSSEKRMAVALRITFTEHNFSVGAFKEFKDKSVKGALTSALEVFQDIQNLITNVQGAVQFATEIVNAVVAAAESFQAGYAALLGGMNQTFNAGGSTADIPTLLPVNNGGTGAPGSGANFPTVAGPTDPYANVPAELVSQTAANALAIQQIIKDMNNLRKEIEALIALIESGAGGRGSLFLHDDIQNLKKAAVLMQDVLDKGIASSQSQIIEYRVPRIMSIREVAFANGISVDLVNEIDLLNPGLLSVNLIAKDTVVKVPIS